MVCHGHRYGSQIPGSLSPESSSLVCKCGSYTLRMMRHAHCASECAAICVLAEHIILSWFVQTLTSMQYVLHLC